MSYYIFHDFDTFVNLEASRYITNLTHISQEKPVANVIGNLYVNEKLPFHYE